MLQPPLRYTHPQLLAVHTVPTNKAVTTKSQRCNCFFRNGGNAIPKRACPEAKAAILPLDLPCSGIVTHCWNILTTGKFHNYKPDRLRFRYSRQM